MVLHIRPYLIERGGFVHEFTGGIAYPSTFDRSTGLSKLGVVGDTGFEPVASCV